MTTAELDISEARQTLSRMPERLRDDPVIWITKHSKRAFAVVQLETMNAIVETLDVLRDPKALRMLRKSFADIEAGRLHDHDDVKKELLG